MGVKTLKVALVVHLMEHVQEKKMSDAYQRKTVKLLPPTHYRQMESKYIFVSLVTRSTFLGGWPLLCQRITEWYTYSVQIITTKVVG
jgi:hypothetical protein